MQTVDFMVSLSMAAMAALALYLHWYPVALFATLFFMLVVINVVIFHTTMPQPRWIIGIGIPKRLDDSEEEDDDE